uniref:Uncharacterized protein n=1 Tax=Octopus bimaculoides TaxID=37653 RepID=A0A0L8I6X3_OCTBM
MSQSSFFNCEYVYLCMRVNHLKFTKNNCVGRGFGNKKYLTVIHLNIQRLAKGKFRYKFHVFFKYIL